MSKQIVDYCAPTLAGLKTSSLFHYKFTSKKELYNTVNSQNLLLNDKGVFLTILKIQNNSALILVYRKALLQNILNQECIREFLGKYNYKEFDIDSCLKTLRKHLNKKDFPHEIGVFLGYPLDDIKGFIENKGQNSKCVGCWKVYNDVCSAKKAFRLFNKCTDVYQKKFSQGTDILKLTVRT